MKIIFGGSFDPIHLGHITIIKYLYNKLHEKIILLPNNGALSYKPSHFLSLTDRINILELIINKYSDYCSLSTIELDNNSYTNTIDSVTKLHSIYHKEMLYFALGYDSFLNLSKWQNWQQLCQQLNFIVFDRILEGDRGIGGRELSLPVSLKSALQVKLWSNLDQINTQKKYGYVFFADMKPLQYSSSMIKHLIITQQSKWKTMLDIEVVKYLLKRGIKT